MGEPWPWNLSNDGWLWWLSKQTPWEEEGEITRVFSTFLFFLLETLLHFRQHPFNQRLLFADLAGLGASCFWSGDSCAEICCLRHWWSACNHSLLAHCFRKRDWKKDLTPASKAVLVPATENCTHVLAAGWILPTPCLEGASGSCSKVQDYHHVACLWCRNNYHVTMSGSWGKSTTSTSKSKTNWHWICRRGDVKQLKHLQPSGGPCSTANQLNTKEWQSECLVIIS